MTSIRVLVADDDEMIRTMLGALISSEPSLELAGTARDTSEAVALAAAQHPDVALLDLDMPGGGGYKAAQEIGERSSGTQVIALTSLDSPQAELDSMRAGAVAFLHKGTSNEEILDAIRSAVRWRAEDAAPAAAAPEASQTLLEQRVALLEQRVAALERNASQS